MTDQRKTPSVELTPAQLQLARVLAQIERRILARGMRIRVPITAHNADTHHDE